MKRYSFLIALFSITVATQAQQLIVDTFDSLVVRYTTPTPSVVDVTLAGEKYGLITLDGYHADGEVGAPSLPVTTATIVVPISNDYEVVVRNARYDTIHNFMASQRVAPQQPSRSKSDTIAHAPVIDELLYATDALYGHRMAQVLYQGIARDRAYATLAFSPLRVNPVNGDVVVCREADVVVRYQGVDKEATIDRYQRYHTPAFSLGTTLNKLFSSKENFSNSPLRLTIVAKASLRCGALVNLANWKRQQGMMVDIVYYDEQGLSGNTAIANYIKTLYTSATTTAPAPTFLLLVGDHEQLPAFDSRVQRSSYYDPDNDHITDLYFTTWTDNDILPDCYYGRFSATDTTTLANIVNKTLLYETYAFNDDAYLAKATLISGVDRGRTSDNAYTYADPTMDYIASTYVNAANGFSTIYYYKNNTDHAPTGVTVTGSTQESASATALRNRYSEGLGWINYSAHGGETEWSEPEFNNTQVNRMGNSGKPSFMIGNCCLSNHFQTATCFGEALLRRANNAGAVAYIGGTNSTYWTEDFYWSVGVRSNIYNTMDATYNSQHLGTYDRLFHTHGESFTDWATTAGAMLVYGCTAVNSASSSSTSSVMKTYYWEIYELMGDPSLMPWLGTASVAPFQCSYNDNCATVTTAPYAYVAVVDSASNELKASAFADANGNVTLCVASEEVTPTTHFTVTAQGYKPLFATYQPTTVGISQLDAAAIRIAPNPATTACRVQGEGLRQVTLLDIAGRTILSTQASDDNATISLNGIHSGIYLVKVLTTAGTHVEKLIVKK